MNTSLPKDLTQTTAQKTGAVIDHLVDALGGEPGCTLRRAVIFTDIDEFPGTTQTQIIERLGAEKSSLNRDIEWLYDHGCILRSPGQDGREISLQTCGYAKKNLDLALEFFDFSHKSLKNFLIEFIRVFGSHKPTLRDAKILALAAENGGASRGEILSGLYNEPATTESRSLGNLVEIGLLLQQDDDTL